nr:MAG TPA: hypothetical protein [Bacteriophage sp.]
MPVILISFSSCSSIIGRLSSQISKVVLLGLIWNYFLNNWFLYSSIILFSRHIL